ncbi:hypothetical protein [Acetobacter cibinongensis]|uniref:Burkholderia phage Bcep781 gp09 n=1 Tax=Acetobacter cibinongensis TaxID=146475 RepID=A0A1Z5YXD4_9PROT|nr:hypothetical protein [Acetobacter cibinongensis]OUJ03965.1 hypothetical protein HK14_14760 [Acetobacter cibinongensis]
MAAPATVTIACKLPTGLVLTVGQVSYTLAGSNSASVLGGYGLTPVPADFWAAWSGLYAAYPPFRQGLIFAQTTAEKAAAQAQEQASLRTGLEAINPQTPAPGITPA